MKLRILLFLNDLGNGDLLIEEVVLGLGLVTILLLDSLSLLELHGQPEVLVYAFTKVLEVQGV